MRCRDGYKIRAKEKIQIFRENRMNISNEKDAVPLADNMVMSVDWLMLISHHSVLSDLYGRSLSVLRERQVIKSHLCPMQCP